MAGEACLYGNWLYTCIVPVMGNVSEFRKAVRLVVDTVHFDKSNTVQVCMPHFMIEIELESFGLRFSKPTLDCLGVFFPLICWWKIPISLGLRLTGTSRICSGLRKMILLGHLLIISIPQPGTWSGWAPSSCFRQDWHWHPLSQGEPEARSSWGLCLSHVLLVKCYHQDGRTTTCTAGGGSLLLEFSLLSRLLGDPIYEIYARRAVAGLYSRRWV